MKAGPLPSLCRSSTPKPARAGRERPPQARPFGRTPRLRPGGAGAALEARSGGAGRIPPRGGGEGGPAPGREADAAARLTSPAGGQAGGSHAAILGKAPRGGSAAISRQGGAGREGTAAGPLLGEGGKSLRALSIRVLRRGGPAGGRTAYPCRTPLTEGLAAASPLSPALAVVRLGCCCPVAVRPRQQGDCPRFTLSGSAASLCVRLRAVSRHRFLQIRPDPQSRLPRFSVPAVNRRVCPCFPQNSASKLLGK